MKYFIISFIVVIILISSYFLFFKKDIMISNIKNFEYSTYDGQTKNGDIVYKIYFDNNKIYASYKKYGEEVDIKEEIDKDTISQLEKILNHYKVSNWNNFHGNNKNVLDGSSFSFYVLYDNDKKIEANGYMKYPSNYQKVDKEIKILFMEIFHENKRG